MQELCGCRQADNSRFPKRMAGFLCQDAEPCFQIPARFHSHSPDFSRFIRYLPVPGKLPLCRIRPLNAPAFAVYKQLHSRGIGTGPDINQLAFVKIPVRKQVHHRFFPIIRPCRLVNIIRILWKARRVQLPEIRAARMVRRRLPDKVKPAPYKLPAGIRMPQLGLNARFRRPGTPARRRVAKRRALLVHIGQHALAVRKMINAPALHDGSGLASINNPVRVLLMVLFIILFPIIIPGIFQDIRTFLCMLPWHVIGRNCNGRIAERVMFFNFLHQNPAPLPPLFTDMRVINLIADAPHQKAWVIAVPAHPAFHVPLVPLWKKPGIIIWIFGRFPHVKRF